MRQEACYWPRVLVAGDCRRRPRHHPIARPASVSPRRCIRGALSAVRNFPVSPAHQVLRRGRQRFRDKGTFGEPTVQVAPRVRLATRLRAALAEAVADSGRALPATVKAQASSSWRTRATSAPTAVVLPDIAQASVSRLGKVEHHQRWVRCSRDGRGTWQRLEPGAPLPHTNVRRIRRISQPKAVIMN